MGRNIPNMRKKYVTENPHPLEKNSHYSLSLWKSVPSPKKFPK